MISKEFSIIFFGNGFEKSGYLIQLLINPKIFYYLNLIKKPTKILFS